MPRKAAQQSLSEQQAAPGGVGAVDRAISLLDLFTPERPTLTLAELATGSRQYKSTVLRLLASLTHSHVVKRHPDGKFSLGSAVSRLHAVYAASFSIERVMLPALKELVDLTRESATFEVRQGEKRLCLLGIDSPQAVRDHTRVGRLLPLGTGAAGRVFKACGGSHASRRDRPAADFVVTAPTDSVKEVSAIAAPVFDALGLLAGVIVLTMPPMRLKPEFAAAVRRVAQMATSDLGGPSASAT